MLCQRCGRTICPACQTQAAVGFHCPECVAEARPATRNIVSGARLRRVVGGRTSVTNGLLIAIGSLFVLDFFLGGRLIDWFAYYVPYTDSEPWRLVTAIFMHQGIMHILFNGYSIWVLGTLMERVMGPGRFLALFLISGLAGSLGVMLLNPNGLVVGASGAVFGLFGALFVMNRGFGGSNVSLLAIVGINLVMGFIIPGVAWQAHVGGLIGGLIAAPLLMGSKR